ncbi:MAG: RNA polymerase factor sigma-54 [Planctomycetes bacterium]|nr:RNA polymerase factor sigma-54 [Planctomycetota bacterium]
MSLRPDLALRTEQRLALAPRMLQSIEILQLATAELAQRIAAEVEANETLEVVREAVHGAQATDAPAPARASEIDEPRDPTGERFELSRRRAAPDAGERKQAMLGAVADRGADLWTHVTEQLALEDVAGELRDKVLALVGLLDEHGYLDVPREQLAEQLGDDGLDDALAVLRALEPVGLGAKGPVDAMLAQVRRDDPDRDAIEAILTRHLEQLAARRDRDVAAALGVEIDELQQLLARIATLEPRPADRFRDESVPPVHPDIVVRRRDDGGYDVAVDDVSLPVLGLQSDYERMAADRALDAPVRRYLRGKLRAARDLLHAVAQRRETLARVAAAVFGAQEPFLRRGRIAIRPLRMSDVADQLGIHTSTVSRAVAGKWVETDHGVCPLRDFFDGARGSSPGADRAVAPDAGVGRIGVQELVRELVAAEDAGEPLSDEELVRRLQARGVRVARRTVAKYRMGLGIPSSWRRRKPGPPASR